MNSELFNRYAENPTIELRNRIVEDNLYMVDILIRKYLGKGVDYDDLYQVRAFALVSQWNGSTFQRVTSLKASLLLLF